MSQAVQLSDGRWVQDGQIVTGAGSSATQAPSWLGLNSDGSLRSSGSGSSAASVARTSDNLGSHFDSGDVYSRFNSGFGSVSSQLSQMMDQIYQITERNTARSEAQAAELRDWQERQNALAMEFNSAEAQKNRDWQQMMSNTAHQREISDLQAAGLNPILSASGGNGAAVTSGATASGVTSSGAKGEVDTSADAALVNLFTTLWSAQTQLESQRINAQNNLAIAEKNNSTSELIAQMYTQQSREASLLAAQTGISQSEISSAASRAVASISANASYYASDISHQNTILNNETSKIMNELNIQQKDRATFASVFTDVLRTGLNFTATLRGQDVQASSAMDVARENHKNNYTGSVWSVLNYLNGAVDNFKNGSSGSWSSGSRGSGFSR